MTSFELDIIDEKSRAGAAFLVRVVDEIRRALAFEKATRKITQQALAEKIGTSRAVINREVQGLENLSARRIGEIFWALNWEPHFEARRPSPGENCDFITPPAPQSALVPPPIPQPNSSPGFDILEMIEKAKAASVLVS
jgi:hypothetical protein